MSSQSPLYNAQGNPIQPILRRRTFDERVGNVKILQPASSQTAAQPQPEESEFVACFNDFTRALLGCLDYVGFGFREIYRGYKEMQQK